jgi:hypothetical protein
MITASAVRAQERTDPETNKTIENITEKTVEKYLPANKFRLSQRLVELDEEWDIERALELNASAVIIAGVLLGLFRQSRWLLVPLAVSGFLVQHALQGWCPPLEVFRRLGLRSSREIERERQALKALRGDYRNMPDRGLGPKEQAELLLAAARK